MIPDDLPQQSLSLPDLSQPRIVILTGSDLRHRRFALRVQKAFGDKVVAWYQIQSASLDASGESGLSRAFKLIHKARKKYLRGSLVHNLLLLPHLVKRRNSQKHWEERIFAREVVALEKHAVVPAQDISSPNRPEFISELETLKANFLLTLGGPIIKDACLDAVKGLAINAHAGWSPDFRGSLTTDWTLHNEAFDKIGATVHLTTKDVDGGAILRRSNPCLVAHDTPESTFCRVVALGTELMIEVVRDILEGREVRAYPQSQSDGRNYRSAEVSPEMFSKIEKLIARGWIAERKGKQQILTS